jgi:hypothetical protein
MTTKHTGANICKVSAESKFSRDKLCDDFPSLFIGDINYRFLSNNYSYKATYYELEQLIKDNKLPLKKVMTKLKRCSKADSLFIKFKDVFDSVKQTFECTCCYDDKEIIDFGQCTDGHLICNSCVKKHATDTIYQKLSSKICCINTQDKCFGTISDSILEKVLDIRIFSEYIILKNMAEIKELCIDDINIKICQHCNAGTDIGEQEQGQGQVIETLICMECFKDTCLKCNQVGHPGAECYALGNVCRSQRQNIEDKMSEAVIIRCGNCNNTIVKDEGCNKVTCLCGNYICYCCKQNVPKSVGYSHFCTEHNCKKPDCKPCHLWDTNMSGRILDAVKDDYNEATKRLIDTLL